MDGGDSRERRWDGKGWRMPAESGRGDDTPPPPKNQHGTRQEVFPPRLLSPPRLLREPAAPQSPWGGPGLDGGAPPGRLHQPDGVPQSLVEVAPQQPADGREVGEIPVAQVFRSRNSKREKGGGGGEKPFPGFFFFLEARCAHRPSGWTTASRCAPGPPAPPRSGRALRRRGGRKGSERRRRAPGWRW